MKNKFNFLGFFQSLKSTLLVTILLFTCVGVWGADGDTHEWTSYSDWGESSKTSWLRNNNATLPTLSYTPQYAVKKVTLTVRQSNTTGSNTVEVTIDGTQVGEIQGMGSETTSFNMEFSPTSALEGEVKILCTNTSANSTGQGTFFLEKITLTEGSAITYTDYITECSNDPSVSVSKSQLTGLDYIANSAVSSRTSKVQTFTVSGSNLTNDISITPNNTNFEISKDGTNYQTTALTLNQTSGSVAQTTISVRLKAGLDASADAYTGTLTVASTGVAESKPVSLSGTVSALALESISVKTAPTKVEYGVGEKFDPTGLVITKNFNDATTSDQPYAGNESTFTFSPGLDDALMISNTTIQITNSEKSVNQTITMKYVVTWNVAGETSTTMFVSGATLTLPTAPAAPSQCSSKSFVGWTADGTYSGGDDAPGDLFKAAGSKTVTENKTYYAVWADVTGSGTAGYNKITSTDDLVNGAEYVVGYQYNSSHIIMSATGYNSETTYLTALSKSPTNDIIAVSDVQANQKWKLVTSNTKFKLYNENQAKYVNATTASTPTLSMGSGGTDFSITYDNSNARWIVSHETNYYVVGFIGSNNYFRAYYSTSLNNGYKIQLYKYNPGATYSDYVVSCTPKVLSKIEVTTNPTKVKYKVGEAFDATGMVVTATYDDASTKTLSSSQYTIDAPTKLATKDVSITIKANEDETKTDDVAINVLALDHITVTGAKTAYEETDYFSTEGMTVTATWGTDPTIVEVIQKGGDNGYTVSKTEQLTLADNNTNVVISYTHEGTTKTANVLITVSAIPTYTVHFYKNGTDDPQTCKRDASVTVPSVVAPKDFEFMGWKKTELSETEDYPTFDLGKDETSYKPTADHETFYAVYKKIHKTEKEGIRLNVTKDNTIYWVGTKSSDYLLAKTTEADAEVFFFEEGKFYYYGVLGKSEAISGTYTETPITEGTYAGTYTYSYGSDADTYNLGLNTTNNPNRFKAYKNNLSGYPGYFTKLSGLKILETYTYSTTAIPDVLTALEIVSGATTTTYYEGDTFDKTGIVAKAVYNTGNKLTVTDQLTYNPLLTTALTTANDKVVVSYTENSVSVSKNQSITVKAITLDNIAVTTQPTKKSYKQCDSFDPSGMVVAATYNDSRKDNANVPLKVGETNGYTFSPATFTELGEQNVTISYTDGTRGTQTTTVAVSVNNALTGIEVTTLPTKVVYTRDEYLDKTGMVVTATYEGGSTKDVSGYTTDFDDVAFTVIGTNEVTVTYTESGVAKTDKFNVTVNDYPHYTVTFKYKKGSTDVTEEIGKGGVMPPVIATTVGVYTFAGWSKTNVDVETTTKPAYVTLTEGKYYPTENETLYAVYTTVKEGKYYGFTLSTIANDEQKYIGSYNNGSTNFNAVSNANNAKVFFDDGGLLYANEDNTKYYYYSGDNNPINRTSTVATANSNLWTVIDGATTGTIRYKRSDSYYLAYNKDSKVFRAYGSTSYVDLIKTASTEYEMRNIAHYFSNPSAAVAGTASFAEETPEISVVDDKMQKNTYTNVLYTNSTGEKTYKSSDEQVATVDNTGKVTVVKGGTVTISVTVAEVEDEFTEAKASYTLTINRLTPTITKKLTENPTVYKGYSIDVADFFETNSDGAKSYSLSSTAFGTLDGSTYTVTGTPGNSSYVNVYLETAETDIYAYKKSEAQYVKVRPLVEQTLSFENASYTFTYGESVADFTNKLSGAYTTVTYESSDEKIATIDADGKVHMVTTSVSGVVTITAKAAAAMAGGIGYSAAQQSYTITIKHAAPALTLTAGEYHSDQLLDINPVAGATSIYYTDNGDDVTWDGTSSNGTKYEEGDGIVLTKGTTTIKAIAIYELNSTLVASAQATATYNLVAPDAPVFSWEDGQTVTTSDVLTIECDKKCYIDYIVVDEKGETVQKGGSNVSPVSINVSAMGTCSVEAFTYWKDTKKADSYRSDKVESTFLMQGPASLPYAYNEFKSGIPGCFITSGTGIYSGSGNTKTQVKFTETGHTIIFQCNEQMNNLYYTVKHNQSDDSKTFEGAGNIFTVFTSENGSNYTALKTHTTMATTDETIEITSIPADARYIKWEYTKKADNTSGNVGLGNIKVGLLPMTFTSGVNDKALKPNDVDEFDAQVSASDYVGTITYTAPDDLDQTKLEYSSEYNYLEAKAGPYTANFTVTAPEDDRYARLTTTVKVEVCGDPYVRLASQFSKGTISTICLPNAVAEGNFIGCTVYEVAGKELVGGEPYKIFFDQVFSLEAGKPYVIELNEGATQADFYYHGSAVAQPKNDDTKGLTGTFTAIDDATNGNSVLMGNYMIYSNQIKKCGEGCLVGKNKAYIKMDGVPEINTNPTPAPGRRRIVLGNAEVQTPTGMVNVNANEDVNAIQKLIIDNQLIIIRNGKMYNAAGALVK